MGPPRNLKLLFSLRRYRWRGYDQFDIDPASVYGNVVNAVHIAINVRKMVIGASPSLFRLIQVPCPGNGRTGLRPVEERQV